MSTEPFQSDHQHETPIKTWKQLVAVIVAAFVVPILGIILLAIFVTHGVKTEPRSLAPDAVEKRIQPLADLAYSFKDVNAPKVLQTGEAVYQGTCVACHGAGVAGAPKAGDPAAWSARISQGYETLLTHALNGIRAMPAKGGNPDLDDIEVARALVFMANQSGAHFKEPAAPVPAKPASSAAANSAPAVAAAAAAPNPITTLSSKQAATVVLDSTVAPTAFTSPSTSTVTAAVEGKKLFEATCQVCHLAGVAGAPKFADKASWAARIKQGKNILYTSALKGKGAMPPKGGSNATDEEVRAAVDYMVSASQ